MQYYTNQIQDDYILVFLYDSWCFDKRTILSSSEVNESIFRIIRVSLFEKTVICPEVFPKIDVVNNVAKFTGKYLSWSFFFSKDAALKTETLLRKKTPTPVFFCEFSEIFKNTFYRTPLATVSKQSIFEKAGDKKSFEFYLLFFSEVNRGMQLK